MILRGSTGKTFKAIATYLLHDKGAETSERVAYTETGNLPTQDPEQAWRWMAATALDQHLIKERAGIGKGGRKLTDPSYHVSLSWHADDKPTLNHMVGTAKDALRVLELDGHQYLLVVHSDTAHPHIHAVVNRVDLETGLAHKLSFSQNKLDEWAFQYEQEHGVRCTLRLDKRGLAHAFEQAEQIERIHPRDVPTHPKQQENELPEDFTARKAGLAAAFDKVAAAQEQAANDPARAPDVSAERLAHVQRYIDDPRLTLKAVTAHQSVFTKRDVVRELAKHTDTEEQLSAALANVMASADTLALKDGEVPVGRVPKFTTREVRKIEEDLVARVGRLAHTEAAAEVDPGVVALIKAGRGFSEQQEAAFDLLMSEERIATVQGAAGTGKSYVLKAVREAYEQQGFDVLGAVLQGKTADDLERDSGIRTQTIHSLLASVEKGFLTLGERSVLMVDEAGMVGSRQMNQLLELIEGSGARMRMIGDTRQLHAVSFGDAFGHIVEQTPVAELTQIRRQAVEWQRDASHAFSQHDIATGLQTYRKQGAVHAHDTDEAAAAALLAQWAADREANPEASQIIMAHTNKVRDTLNRMARAQAIDAGGLDAEAQTTIKTEKGALEVAPGDRLMFGKNDYDALKVKNGSLGTVRGIEGGVLQIETDDGRTVAVDPKTYGHLDYGYALTVHKAQGMTVDRAYLMASPSMSAETTYVGMTRHREGVALFYGEEAFEKRGGLDAALSRRENKTFSADYERDPDADLTRRAQIIDLEKEREARRAEAQAKLDADRVRREIEAAEAARAQAAEAQEAAQRSQTADKPRYKLGTDGQMRLVEAFEPVAEQLEPEPPSPVRAAFAEASVPDPAPAPTQHIQQSEPAPPALAPDFTRAVEEPASRGDEKVEPQAQTWAEFKAQREQERVARDREDAPDRPQTWEEFKAQREQERAEREPTNEPQQGIEQDKGRDDDPGPSGGLARLVAAFAIAAGLLLGKPTDAAALPAKGEETAAATTAGKAGRTGKTGRRSYTVRPRIVRKEKRDLEG